MRDFFFCSFTEYFARIKMFQQARESLVSSKFSNQSLINNNQITNKMAIKDFFKKNWFMWVYVQKRVFPSVLKKKKKKKKGGIKKKKKKGKCYNLFIS